MKNKLWMGRLLLAVILAPSCWVLSLPGTAHAAMTNVSIVDFAFSPRAVTIAVNDQVRWAWMGTEPHSTTSDTGLWNSGVNDQGSTFTNTFSSAGNFPYHCTVHASMTASVAVQGNSAPSIMTQPQSRTVAAGTNLTLTVSASGALPLSYQWQFGGAPISGATDSSLAINNIQFLNAGSYSVVVTNDLGMTLSSNAILNVVGPKGIYNGLFFDPNDVSLQSSGAFSVSTTTGGKFSGKLQIGSRRSSFSGQFDGQGNASNSVRRANQSPLSVVLHLDSSDADKIDGTVSNGITSASVAGDRAVFDGRQRLSPQAGQYTMIIPGGDSSSLPGGDSYGTLTVDKTGKVKLAGSLADGTKISQSVTISKNGEWPLFVPLYGGLGSIFGWITFESTGTNDLAGDVVWLKSNIPNAKFYAAGFSFPSTAEGFRYHPPLAGARLLSFTNGTVALSGGDLAAGVTNLISVDARNRITNTSSNRLSLTIKSSTGVFSGRVTVPGTSQSFSFSGVLLQDLGLGRGYFLGTTQSGQAVIQPLP